MQLNRHFNEKKFKVCKKRHIRKKKVNISIGVESKLRAN